MNRMKSTILTCGMIVLFLNTMIFASINGIDSDSNSSPNAVPMSSDLGDWDAIAEDISVEWDDTTVDDNLRESIYSLVVGDWVWTNPFTLEDILFDEIEVRRLVRADIYEYHDAILILPMMFVEANAMFHWEDYFTGEQLNNPEDMFVYPYIEAGFDVYCLSPRDHNVPIDFMNDPASYTEMMRWGAEEYLSDIHEAVELIKVVSGFDRIYLNTQEIGTALGMMYAVEHEENLKGIVAISGCTGGMLDKPPFIPIDLPPEVLIEDLNAVYEFIEADGPWFGLGSTLFPFVHQYYYEAFKYPDSEDIAYTPFGEISWFMTLGYFTNFGGTGDPALWEFILLFVLGLPLEPGTLSAGAKINAIELYIPDFLGVSLLIPGISLEAREWLGFINILHPFYPWRVLIDIQHMSQVENSVYLELDWDDHFDDINIPILTFVDTLAINWWDQADYSDDTRNPDNIVYIMENQGVLDLILGAQYRELIIQTSIQWIFDRNSAQHVSVGEIYIDGETIEVIMFLHEDYIDVFKIYEREYITFEVIYYNDNYPNKIIWEATDEVYGDIYGGIYTDGRVEFTGEEFVFYGVEVININDVTKPVIDILSPSEGVIINQEVVLTYMVSDDVSAPENIVITGPVSGATYTSEGYYHEIITATDEAGNTATASVSFVIDKTAPEIIINGPPEGCYNTDQTVSWSVSDTNLDINSISANYPEFRTFDTEGTYQVEVSAFDLAGNFATASSAQFVIDKSEPITSIEFDPPYFEINNIVHLTSITPIELKPVEIQGGSGIFETYYKIFNETYDSGLILYTDIFSLDYIGLYDGSYNLEYFSIDIAGNSEDANSKQIVIDNSPPELSWEYEDYAVQDRFLFKIEAFDATRVTSVTLSIRELNGQIVAQIPVEYMGESKWRALESFDTTTLPDDNYELVVNSTDLFGFTTTEIFDFSIRNWAIIVLLPSTKSNKAGRTMPVKFALRVDEAVDPNMPFVVNQELDVFIVDTTTGEILQHSTYGDASKDYRINEVIEHYITNFKTHKTPKKYLVRIYRRDFFIGEFSFVTKR